MAARGKTARLWIWENARWHGSTSVRVGIGSHTRAVKRGQVRGRSVICRLPAKRAWCAPIVAKWRQGTWRIGGPARLLAADASAQRVCEYFGGLHEPHLLLTEAVC